MSLILVSALGCATVQQDDKRLPWLHNTPKSYEIRAVIGKPFIHQTISMNLPGQGALHVYIHGDNLSASLHGGAKPLNSAPLLWSLMQHDINDSVLIARPCYYLTDASASQHCDQSHWLSHRFSEQVLNSMAHAIKGVATQYPDQPITLIGYSGGGALALLLAHRIDNVHGVVTLAGNVDTDAWQKHHQYKPLTGSLNPMTDARLTGVNHLHVIGDSDSNVLAAWTRQFAEQHLGRLSIKQQLSHEHGWTAYWPDILQLIQSLDTAK